MKIRKAVKRDYEKCKEIIYACLKKLKISNKEKDFLRKRYKIENIERFSKKWHICVFEKNGKIQASGRLKDSEIGMMYVNPKYQRQKIGSRIMKHLENLAKKNGRKKVHIQALTPAINFYKKLGYAKIKEKKPNKDFCKMEKIIK